MPRFIVASAAIAVFLLTSSDHADAQRSRWSRQESDEKVEAQKNSSFCDFTYFTNAADNLEFRGSEENRCFDMKGGDDVLILNRSAFPSGVRIFTGSGRDTVWATDADDMVRDGDGNDKEIRTYDGDDTIEIEVPIDEDPNRGVEATQRTEIRPGRGKNRILMPKVGLSDAFPRYSPDVWLTTESEGHDTVEADCGRPLITSPFDFRSMEIPETSSISYKTNGCSVGIFGLYGDADVKMTGGRLALQTYNEGFRVPDGEHLPRITGEVKGGIGLTLDIDKSSPDSLFSWEGTGSAYIRSRIRQAGSGGRFQVRSAREVSYQGEMTAGNVSFDLAAKGVVKLDIVSSGGRGQTLFSMAASRMDVAWRLAGEGGFPDIVNDAPITYSETNFVTPEIDWKGPRDDTAQARSQADVEDPDLVTNPSVPANVPSIEEQSEDVVVTPGNTRLRLQLRRENDRFGKCVSFRLVDHEGVEPVKFERCESLEAPLKRVVVNDATAYEEIVIEGDGVDLRIPINAASHFVVDRIEAEL